ncbi:MAG TPA: crosslink repair DNA glycosylase YcaQ family protein [Anaerolineaceae bacterium]|nr:crosslink repair DNA glycosylase YcaQ family protein [Anaerolineaceae bacterium]
MTIPALTVPQVRLIQLHALGLLHPPSSAAVKADVLTSIRRMGLLQIDTIHVVARSPYFVLFSRLGEYNPTWLDELLAEGSLFEQWAHAACFIPIEDYPLIRRQVLDNVHGSYFSGWVEENAAVVQQVLSALQERGPLRSADFKSPKQPGGWWNWKEEKIALEYLFSQGELVVVRRENFQRVYDLHERAKPDWDDSLVPPLEEVYRSMVLKTIKVLGVALPAWVADYYRLPKRLIPGILSELLASGALRETQVEGWNETGLYLPEDEPLLDAARTGDLDADHTTLLSPFDPLTWDRARVRQLFGFDFMIQAYTKAEKRTFGYFPLPILRRGQLVGRMEAKAFRKEGVFEVRGLYLEHGVEMTRDLASDLARAVELCAQWHKTPQVVLSSELPEALANALDQELHKE